MFERFTELARQAVVFAQEEARSLEHNYIGTEHLLLGLLREEEGVGTRALKSLGVSLEGVRGQVAQIIGREVRDTDLLGHTDRGTVALVLLDADFEHSTRVIDRVISLDDLVEAGIRPLAEGTAKGKIVVTP